MKASVSVPSRPGKLVVARESMSIANIILRLVPVVLSTVSISGGGVVALMGASFVFRVPFCSTERQRSYHTSDV